MRASASSFISSTSTTTIGVNDLKSDATKLPRPKAPAADIEYRLNAFESNALNQSERIETVDKKTLPKVDINKRREMFEKESNGGKSFESTGSKAIGELTATISIKDRLSSLQNREEVNVRDAAVKKLNRLSGEFSRVKDRLSNIESPIMNIDAVDEKLTIIDVPVVPLKDRLITLHSAAFQEKPRDPAGAKKIDLLTDQKPNEEKREELNGNEYQYHSETTLIQYNVEYNGSTNYNSVEPGKNGSYLNESLANLLGAQIVENNGDIGLPLEAIQEEREEQQLTSILPKKPEVMPRTTRIITPDSHKIEFQNEARNGDILQSEMITDFNDDDDNEDVSVSSSVKNVSICKNTHVYSSIDNTVKVDRSAMVVENNAVAEANTIQDSNSILPVNVLTPELTLAHDSILDSNHNYEVDNNHETIELISEPRDSQIDEENISSFPQKINTVNVPTLSDELDANCKMETTIHSSPINSSSCIDILDKNIESESSLSKNQRIKCQIVGVLEKNRKPSIDEGKPIENLIPVEPLSPPPRSPMSPKSPKSPISPGSPRKTKNIFDFIKRNLLNEAGPDAPAIECISQSLKSPTIPSAQIGSETASLKSIDLLSSDIDQFLDEELNKLSEDELQ